jgi:hypothetical protein
VVGATEFFDGLVLKYRSQHRAQTAEKVAQPNYGSPVESSIISPSVPSALKQLRISSVELIYGTVRFIERDDESFLPLGEAGVRVHDLQPTCGSQPRGASGVREMLFGSLSIWQHSVEGRTI